jgi:hypothetical protein
LIRPCGKYYPSEFPVLFQSIDDSVLFNLFISLISFEFHWRFQTVDSPAFDTSLCCLHHSTAFDFGIVAFQFLLAFHPNSGLKLREFIRVVVRVKSLMLGKRLISRSERTDRSQEGNWDGDKLFSVEFCFHKL